MLNIACTNEQKHGVIVAPQTIGGRPAAIDGALTVTVVSGDGTVEQDPGTPLEFKAVSGDSVETDTVYDVAGDADLGAGVVTIHDTVTLHVTSASAVSFGLSAGLIEQK